MHLFVIYIFSRKTLRSLLPEIGEFAGRTGKDRAGQDRAGQGRAEQKQSRACGQKAGRDIMVMGIVQYELSNCAGQVKNAGQGKKGQNRVSRSGQL